MPLAPTAPKPPRLRAPKVGLVVAGRPYRAGVFLPESARPVLEALARPAAPASAPARVIGILGFSYRVEPIAIDPAIGDVAFSLHDTDRNRLHHVHRATLGEVVCDCGDFTYRRQGTGSSCKHIRRLAELAMIPAAVAPTFAAARPSASPPAWRRRFEPTPDEFRQAAEMLNA